MQIDSTTPKEIIRILSEKLKACYVFPDIAEQICTHLQMRLEDGEYDDITDGEILALALTMHLQEASRDEHLWVRWHSEPLPEEESQLRLNQEWQAERMLEARLDNFGLHKVERLPGNVGYIDIHYLHQPAWGGDTVTAAMSFLANTSALIIDLRNCTGGYPGMIALILSYLFGEEPIHLTDIYWRDEDRTQQYWTLPHVSGKRFSGKPVYVLISNITFSGGEEFASILQTRKRATIIGNKTDGSSRPGASYRLHPHFEVFIPIGRTINPLTGTDFEGIGISPDILVPQELSFTISYKLALEAILADLSQFPIGPFKSLADEAQMVLQDMKSNKKF